MLLGLAWAALISSSGEENFWSVLPAIICGEVRIRLTGAKASVGSMAGKGPKVMVWVICPVLYSRV
ncbi:hypothetical protein D3C72_2487000 [compost metagenome]